MDEEPTQERLDKLWEDLEESKIHELSEKITYNELKALKAKADGNSGSNDPRGGAGTADPRRPVPQRKPIQDAFKTAEKVKKKVFEYLTANPEDKHRMHELNELIKVYNGLNVIIKDAEILMKMVESSKSIYNQASSAENIDELLDSVDIKIYELENKTRAEAWTQKVSDILKGVEAQQKHKLSEITNLTSPPSEWGVDKDLVMRLKSFISEQKEWYRKAKKEAEDPEAFKEALEKHWFEFDDTSFDQVKNETPEQPSRKRKADEPLSDPRALKQVKK